MQNKIITVLGAGSWGTALATHLALNRQHVRLWGRDAEQISEMKKNRVNAAYLPNFILPDNLEFFADLETALKESTDILITVPSHAFRATLLAIKNYCTPQRLVWAVKGLDPQSHQLLHEVCQEIFPGISMAVLAGPSFAKEVIAGMPTAVAIATPDKKFLNDLIHYFHSKRFRVYGNDDIVGVEISGAMKNVLAIAIGMADGLGFGANARSALITRGLAEMLRLGLTLGGKQETFIGLAGLGDLVLTCTDNQSRNRRFGLALGEGKTKEEALAMIGQVTEGFNTAVEIFHLAQKNKIEVPICEQVYKVLHENLSAWDAVENLLAREPKNES